MIDFFNLIIGRAYAPLQDSGHAISTIAGVDFEWVISALLIILLVYQLIKFFIRIFIQ